jgi:16S rRNA (guanine527-N7)-methyltransferase
MKQHSISYYYVSRETLLSTEQLIEKHKPKIEEYIRLLLWWNKRINLVSRDVSRETLFNHIHHSLLLTQLKPYKESDFIVDAGTGGGLPGIILAITSPQKQFLLNDIASKKILAVKQMARKLALSNIETFNGSISQLQAKEPFLLISKHAFKINQLYHLCTELPWEKMLFLKGLNFEDELEGIETPLEVSAGNLSKVSANDFYSGKAIITISK